MIDHQTVIGVLASTCCGPTYRHVEVKADIRHRHGQIGMGDAHHHHPLREQVVPGLISRCHIVPQSLGIRMKLSPTTYTKATHM